MKKKAGNKFFSDQFILSVACVYWSYQIVRVVCLVAVAFVRRMVYAGSPPINFDNIKFQFSIRITIPFFQIIAILSNHEIKFNYLIAISVKLFKKMLIMVVRQN